MTLILDYDGTLHDTKALYGAAVRKALAKLEADGFTADLSVTDERLSRYLGMTADEMWRSFMPALPTDIMKKAAKAVGENMKKGIYLGEAHLYAGVTDALSTLKADGMRLVILSNCDKAYLEAHRAHFDLDRFFAGYFPAESFGYALKAAVVPHIIERFPDDRYIVVGDRSSDLEAARKNGLPFVGCAYGFGEEGELDGSDIVISSPWELVSAVRSLVSEQ